MRGGYAALTAPRCDGAFRQPAGGAVEL